MSKVVWVDLPDISYLEEPEGPWVNVKTFRGENAKAEAIAYIREHIDPSCDEEGRIQLIVEGEEPLVL